MVVGLRTFATALLLASIAPNQRAMSAETLEGPVKAHVERVLDGDTLEVTAIIWLDQTLTIRVRIDRIDTPELEARCADERHKALAARDFLVRRIEGAEVRLSQIVYDKYGARIRAAVADARGDIGQALIAAGLARSYQGAKRLPWCDIS